MANVTREGFIQTAGFGLQSSDFHVHTRAPQLLKTSPAYFGIGIVHGSNHAMNSGSDQSVGAWRRAALVRVGFEIDVEGAAAGFRAGLLEGEHLGVLHAIVGVDASAHDAALRVDDHSADIGIWRS